MHIMALTSLQKAEEDILETTEPSRVGNVMDNIVAFSDQINAVVYLVIAVAVVFFILRWLFNNRARINSVTEGKLRALTKEKKYIPGIFVELTESKEYLRYFSFKNKWKHRIVSEFNALFHDYYGSLLKEMFAEEDVAFELSSSLDIEEITTQMKHTKGFLKDLHEGKIKVPERYSSSSLIFRVFSNKYDERIEDLVNKSCFAKARYIILTGSAGNGKTNLLCNYSEFLINQGLRCVFMNGKEINTRVEEHFWKQLGIPDMIVKNEIRFAVSKYLFWKILSLRFEPLYILIDAVNENNNKSVLESYHEFFDEILRKPNTYIVVACRSEYFEARFKKYLVDDVEACPIVENIVEESYPDVAIQRLFRNYAEMFNYHCKLSHQVKERLSKQLLLTRIFFETYSGRTDQVSDLDLNALYEAYIDRVSNEQKVDVLSYLDEIVKIMIDQKNYRSVSLSDISVAGKMIHDKIDGTVLVSKTIVYHPDSLIRNEDEVVYFVFDELRDYCLARYQLRNICSTRDKYPSNEDIIFLLDELNADNAVCLEGVINYVYREGQKRGNSNLCCIILNKFIDPVEVNTRRGRLTELGRGTRLILDNPQDILPCEKEFLCNKLKTKNTHYISMFFSYFVDQELYEGSPNLSLFFEILRAIGNPTEIAEIVFRCASSWDPQYISRKDFIDIDKKLMQISPDSVNRFRKFEILYLFCVKWEGKEELTKYLKDNVQSNELDKLAKDTAIEFGFRRKSQ